MKPGEPLSSRRIGGLSIIASAIADADNLLEVLGLIADETLKALGADEVAISRYEADDDRLRVLAVSSRPPCSRAAVRAITATASVATSWP